jgi:hypothetical protein
VSTDATRVVGFWIDAPLELEPVLPPRHQCGGRAGGGQVTAGGPARCHSDGDQSESCDRKDRAGTRRHGSTTVYNLSTRGVPEKGTRMRCSGVSSLNTASPNCRRSSGMSGSTRP